MSKYSLDQFNYNLKTNSWERVPRDPMTVGLMITGGYGYTTAGILASMGVGGTFTYLIGLAATTLVTGFLLSALAPKPPKDKGRELTANIRDAAAPRDIVYGEVRKGGVITHLESTDDNQYLHMFISLAGHEIESIEGIYINDEDQTANWTRSTGLVNGGDDTDWKNKVRIFAHLGAQTSATDTFEDSTKTLANTYHTESELDDVDSNFIGKGVAYLYIRHHYDKDVYADGIPEITAVVRGKKVQNTSGVAQTYPASANAALVIRDYLINEYGVGDDSTNIDETVFATAQTVCDTNSGSGDANKFEVNGVLSTGNSRIDNLETLTAACGGALFWGAGKWKLKAAAYTSPVKTLTMGDLRSSIQIDTKHSVRDNFNAVQGTFFDKDQDWIEVDYPQIAPSEYLTEDNNEKNVIDLPFQVVTNSAQAQRLAKLTLNRHREQLTFTANFGLEAFDLEVGDVIKFNDYNAEDGTYRYGFYSATPADQKTFEVIGWKLSNSSEDQDIQVSLTLRETSSTAFDWDAEEVDIVGNNTTLPNFTDVSPINGLKAFNTGFLNEDGNFVPRATLDWDNATGNFFDHYEVQHKNNFLSNVTLEQHIDFAGGPTTTSGATVFADKSGNGRTAFNDSTYSGYSVETGGPTGTFLQKTSVSSNGLAILTQSEIDNMDTTNGFGHTFWVRIDDYSAIAGDPRIISRDFSDYGAVRFLSGTTWNNSYTDTNISLTEDEWYFFYVARAGNLNTFKVYEQDGTEVINETSTQTYSTDRGIAIFGNSESALEVIESDGEYANLDNDHELKASIADIRLHDGAILTDAQVLKLLSGDTGDKYDTITTQESRTTILGYEIDDTVAYRVRAVNNLGFRSDFTSGTLQITGDDTAPSAPTSFTATGIFAGVNLDWTNPDVSDFDVVEVYRNTTNSSSTATKIAEVKTDNFSDTNLTVNTTYYYWLKARDRTGNKSDFSAIQSAVTTYVTESNIDPTYINSVDTAAESAAAAALSEAAAEAAQTAAETAETNAETAQTAAEAARTAAQTAQTAAETAKAGAETAETGATTAQTAAETAQSNAETAQAAAEEAYEANLLYNLVENGEGQDDDYPQGMHSTGYSLSSTYAKFGTKSFKHVGSGNYLDIFSISSSDLQFNLAANQKFTWGMWVYNDTGASINPEWGLAYGGGWATTNTTLANGTWTFIQASGTIASSAITADEIRLELRSDTNSGWVGNLYLDGIMLVEGEHDLSTLRVSSVNIQNVKSTSEDASAASTSAATATTKASEAATSATSASTSANTATTKASEAATSATNAATSETNASGSASSASTSATTAATSATNAATSETNAETAETNINETVPILGLSRFTAPKEQWTNQSPSTGQFVGSTGLRKTAVNGNDLVTGDSNFGEAYDFNNTSNATVGQAYPFDYISGNVYEITCKFYVESDGTTVPDAGGAAGVQHRIGVSTFTNRTSRQVNIQDDGTVSRVADGVVTKTVWFSNKSSSDLPTLPSYVTQHVQLTGSSLADVFFPHLRQNYTGTGTTNGTVIMGQMVVKDVTALVDSLNEAEDAASSATAASTSASTATTKASEAATSATTATTKASEASTSAANAATSETNAATSETNAATSESNASTSETNAATSATDAETSATNASTSATTATTKANEAASSATAAASSATTASTKAGEASTSASEAATSATNASGSASSASTSATTAANSATAAEDARDAQVHQNMVTNSKTKADALLARMDATSWETSTTYSRHNGRSWHLKSTSAESSPDIWESKGEDNFPIDLGDGQTWTWGFWAYQNTGSTQTVGGAFAGDGGWGNASKQIPDSTWTLVTGTGTSNSSGSYIATYQNLILDLRNNITNLKGNLWVDEVMVVLGDVDLSAVTVSEGLVESSQDASDSASAASTSATSASTSATNAATSASTATTKASEASTSAANAATSESNAATSETNAATSESNASTSESNAATSETNASTSATNAANSATTATTKASDAASSATAAAGSASTATTKASEASTSASQAATSATNASGSASSAATQATTAANARKRVQLVDGGVRNAGFEIGYNDLIGVPAGWIGDAHSSSAFSLRLGYQNDVDSNSDYASELSFGTLQTNAGHWWSLEKYFSAAPSQTFAVSARVRMLTLNYGSLSDKSQDNFVDEDDWMMVARWYDEDGELLSSSATVTASVRYRKDNSSNPSSNTWFLWESESITAPANTAYVKLELAAVDATGTVVGDRTAYKTAADFRGGNSACLIDDVVFSSTNGDILEIEASSVDTAASAAAAATSETNAAASETAAASSASSASTSANTATTKASQASTSATQAATSATNASNSASSASTSATTAANSVNNIVHTNLVTNSKTSANARLAGMSSLFNTNTSQSKFNSRSWRWEGNTINTPIWDSSYETDFPISIEVGNKYSWGAWVYQNTGSSIGVQFAFQQGGGWANTVHTVPNAVWTWVYDNGTAPSSVGSSLVLDIRGGNVGTLQNSLWIDGLVVVEGEVDLDEAIASDASVGYRDSSASSASAASTSASAASTSASNAASSASTATTQANTATTKAGEASTSATQAATSATNADTSALTATRTATRQAKINHAAGMLAPQICLKAAQYRFGVWEDDTTIYKNGVELVTLDRGSRTSWQQTLALGDRLTSSKPFYALSVTNDPYTIPLASEAMADTRFYALVNRYDTQTFNIYPLADGNAHYTFSSTHVGTTPVTGGTDISLTAGTVTTLNPVWSSGTIYFNISSDVPILIVKYGAGGDGALLMPPSETIFEREADPINWVDSGSASSSSSGGKSESSDGVRRLAAFNTADGSGGDAEGHIGIEALGDEYVLPCIRVDNHWMISPEDCTVTIKNNAGTVEATINLTANSATQTGSSQGSGSALYGSEGPYYFSGTKPFALQAQVDDFADEEMHYGFRRDLKPRYGTEAITEILQSSVTDLEGNQEAAIVLRAKAGTGGAQLELVAGDDVEGGSVSTARIDADNIILDGSVTADHIEAGTITADEISSSYAYTGNLNAGQINAGTIDANRISVNSLSSLSANLGTVNAGTLKLGNLNVNSTNMQPTGGVGIRLESDGDLAFGDPQKYVKYDASAGDLEIRGEIINFKDSFFNGNEGNWGQINVSQSDLSNILDGAGIYVFAVIGNGGQGGQSSHSDNNNRGGTGGGGGGVAIVGYEWDGSTALACTISKDDGNVNNSPNSFSNGNRGGSMTMSVGGSTVLTITGAQAGGKANTEGSLTGNGGDGGVVSGNWVNDNNLVNGYFQDGGTGGRAGMDNDGDHSRGAGGGAVDIGQIVQNNNTYTTANGLYGGDGYSNNNSNNLYSGGGASIWGHGLGGNAGNAQRSANNVVAGAGISAGANYFGVAPASIYGGAPRNTPAAGQAGGVFSGGSGGWGDTQTLNVDNPFRTSPGGAGGQWGGGAGGGSARGGSTDDSGASGGGAGGTGVILWYKL